MSKWKQIYRRIGVGFLETIIKKCFLVNMLYDIRDEFRRQELLERMDLLEGATRKSKSLIYVDRSDYQFSGKNITAIRDNGTGNFTVIFTEDMEMPYSVVVNPEDSALSYNLTKSNSSLGIQFFDPISREPTDTSFLVACQ